jgi:hypothetical protein
VQDLGISTLRQFGGAKSGWTVDEESVTALLLTWRGGGFEEDQLDAVTSRLERCALEHEIKDFVDKGFRNKSAALSRALH